MRTPDYILVRDYEIQISVTDRMILKAGSFVRPIDPYYIPKELVMHKFSCKWHNDSTDTLCYTHYGIISIAKDAFRQV